MLKTQLSHLALRLSSYRCHDELSILKKISTPEKLTSFQEEKLTQLLLHAYKNVPYYTKVFKKIGLIENGKVDLSKFDQIPILTKDIIRTHQKELTAKDIESRFYYHNSSGGSTGEPLHLLQDRNYRTWGRAVYYYYYGQMLGVDELGSRKVIVWGAADDIFKGSASIHAKITKFLSNTVFFNAFRMNNKTMSEYLNILNRYKPVVMRGYASALFDFAHFVQEKKITSLHQPKLIVSTAENLEDRMRSQIEKVFKSPVFDFYGSREVGCIAGECKNRHLHSFSFSNKLEIVDAKGNPAKEGEMGQIIITNLYNYAMPLIRYEIQDTAVAGNTKCDCGSPLPTVKALSGRVSNHFIRKDGGLVAGPALTLTFNMMGWVNTFQILQEDYEKIRLFIVPQGRALKDDQKEVERKLKILMGDKCQIIWDFVKEIPKTKSGKHLFTRSLINEKQKTN